MLMTCEVVGVGMGDECEGLPPVRIQEEPQRGELQRRAGGVVNEWWEIRQNSRCFRFVVLEGFQRTLSGVCEVANGGQRLLISSR